MPQAPGRSIQNPVSDGFQFLGAGEKVTGRTGSLKVNCNLKSFRDNLRIAEVNMVSELRFTVQKVCSVNMHKLISDTFPDVCSKPSPCTFPVLHIIRIVIVIIGLIIIVIVIIGLIIIVIVIIGLIIIMHLCHVSS